MGKMSYINRETFYEAMLKRFGCVPALTDYSSALKNDIHLDEALNSIPVIDAVEVVRCKDCIFGHKDDNYHLGYACEKPLYHPAIGEKPHRKLMQDCDYCSHGVRKTD